MENSVKLPDNFYERLYDQIMDYDFGPESVDEKTCTMYIDIDDFTVELDATFDVYIEDNSFDHAFGTEHIYDLAVGELEDVEVTQIWYCNDECEKDVTDLYDDEKFWLQFKQFVIKRGSHYIHHGDEVVVRSQCYRYSPWVKMTFLYYDTRLGKAVCTPSIHAKYISKRAYPYVFPATTANLALVK
jgi:hypothetical protein